MTRTHQRFATFCTLANNLAAMSTCKRRQCGAIIIAPDFSEVLAIGYNGPSRGRKNDACRDEPKHCGCIHAEANAIAKLRRDVRDMVMICTTAPCEHCAGLIVNSRAIRFVLWHRPYTDGLGLLALDAAEVWHAQWHTLEALSKQDPYQGYYELDTWWKDRILR